MMVLVINVGSKIEETISHFRKRFCLEIYKMEVIKVLADLNGTPNTFTCL